jgi:ribose 1,5-bisphosphate isomerase
LQNHRIFASFLEPRLYPTLIRQATSEYSGPKVNDRDFRSRNIPEEALKQIASDTTSGAAEILRQAGAAFTQLSASSPPGAQLEQAQQAILDTCTGLVLAQPEMTPVLRLAGTALSASRIASDARDALNCAEVAALNFIENAVRSAGYASTLSAVLIQEGASVLTHSRSSTVLAALVEARRSGTSFSVIVTESRPMLEGRAVAASLVVEGIPVALIADAAASLAIDQVDLVMIGADTITPINLINKIGTRLIALAAREKGVPVFAVSDSSKFIREDYSEIRRFRNPDELWRAAPARVSVVNSYFEPTPVDWFGGIVTEDGILSAAEATRRARETTIDLALVEALRVSLEGIK